MLPAASQGRFRWERPPDGRWCGASWMLVACATFAPIARINARLNALTNATRPREVARLLLRLTGADGNTSR